MSNFKMHPQFKFNGNSFHSQLEFISFSETVSEDLYWFLQEWFSDSDTLIVKTSGSTGTPKLVAIQKQHMRNSAKATGVFFDLKAESKALCCLSINYIAGKMMVVRALELGWHLDVVAAVSNPLENCYKTYDFCAMVPMQVKASLWDLRNVQKLLIGGGMVSENLQKVLQTIDTECYASYGMTETVSHIAIKRLNSQVKNAYYEILPDITIFKDDRDCLVIKAPLLSESEVITNDIVAIHDANQFEWLGRYDNVVNSGGVKLHPEQIEKKLAHILKQRFFVIGVADEILGEKLVLVVEGTTEKIALEDANLSKYEYPKAIYFADTFLETETKKIQRKQTLDFILKNHLPK